MVTAHIPSICKCFWIYPQNNIQKLRASVTSLHWKKQFQGAKIVKMFALYPSVRIQVALGGDQVPWTCPRSHPWNGTFESRPNPRHPAFNSRGRSLGSPRLLPCQEFREFIKPQTDRFVCRLLRCSFLFSHEADTLIVYFLVGGRYQEPEEGPVLNSTKTFTPPRAALLCRGLFTCPI